MRFTGLTTFALCALGVLIVGGGDPVAKEDEATKAVSFRVECAQSEYEAVVEAVLERGGRVFDLETGAAYEIPKIETTVPLPLHFGPVVVALHDALAKTDSELDGIHASEYGATLGIRFPKEVVAETAKTRIDEVLKAAGLGATLSREEGSVRSAPGGDRSSWLCQLVPVPPSEPTKASRTTVRRISMWALRKLLEKHNVSIRREEKLYEDTQPAPGVVGQYVELGLLGKIDDLVAFLRAMDSIPGLFISKTRLNVARGRRTSSMMARFEIRAHARGS
ncbi:MAG: hypothetical protein QNJ98_13670 [Planctomycetota bacterium]|nr:hypothetical protein [Planctomycetota bacterium]